MVQNRHTRCYLLLAGSFLLCCLAAGLSLCLGNLCFSPLAVIRILCGHAESTVSRSILLYARIPRTLGALLSGAALSVSGATLQQVLANKLTSPSIIGVNAGAGLGVTICCAAGAISGWMISTVSFAGSLCAVLLISLFASRTNASKTTVILGGVALNSILNAINEAITVLDPDVAALNTEFRVGGFSAVSYTRLLPAMILICVGCFLLFSLRNELDIVTLGDAAAHSLGLPVRFYRILFLILSALLAGAAVSFSGLLGFVGLIVPHIARRFVSSESRWLLPFSACCGAAFVTICDLLSRFLFMPYELPVGIIMALIGGPTFVVLLVRMHHGKSGMGEPS